MKLFRTPKEPVRDWTAEQYITVATDLRIMAEEMRAVEGGHSMAIQYVEYLYHDFERKAGYLLVKERQNA